MEEEKAAAYYEELSRKGEGAAKYKQGLGFSSHSSNDAVPSLKGSALPSSSSSFLSNFVRASSPKKASDLEKQARLANIQNKLTKKTSASDTYSGTHSRHRSPVREDRRSTQRRRSRSRERERYRDRDRDRDRDRERRSRRSVSPEGDRKSKRSKSDGTDYANLIKGYDKMSPAERVKAKMQLQLSEAAKKDSSNGKGPGWERFDFDKDAPLDDEEIEAAEDDSDIVKHIGQSFRFSAVEAKREEKLKAAHDEAMFGAPSLLPPVDLERKIEENNQDKQSAETASATSLLSDHVLAKQQGSWRDRVRKV